MSDKKKDFDLSPFYIRFDPKKQYEKLLAIPGRVAQASDWNDSQYLMSHKVKTLGDSIFKEGNIISGMELSVFEDETTKKPYARVEDGKVYLEGSVREFHKTIVPIEGKGKDNICVFLKSSLITEFDDTTLFDPAEGYENYGQPGMNAIKEEVGLAVNLDNAPIIYKLVDGKLDVKKSGDTENDGFAKITEVLARRTYEESGNYRKSGLRIYQRFDYPNPEKNLLYFTCSKGKAYVLGYEVEKPTDFTFTTEKATETRLVRFDSSPIRKNETTGKYYLIPRFSPIEDVKGLSVNVRATVKMTRGTQRDGEDNFPFTNVSEVEEVRSGTTIYKAGVDYRLSGDQLVWRSYQDGVSGNQPNPGTEYQVRLKYYKDLSSNPENFNISNRRGKEIIEILDTSLDVNELAQTSISYTFYLARKDLVSIDRFGKIIVTKGTPDLEVNCSIPVVTDDNTLPLGSIFLKGNSDTAFIINKSIEDSSMLDIQNTIQRVTDLEYNSSITDLDKKAIEGEPATQLKGVFTDGFISYTKGDLNYDRPSKTFGEKVKYDCCIDIDTGELKLPYTMNNIDLTVNPNGSSGMGHMGAVMTTNYTEEVSFDQPLATTRMQVNPYQVFDPFIAVTLEPSVDNWIDYEHITQNIDGGTENHQFYIGYPSNWWRDNASKYNEGVHGDMETVVTVGRRDVNIVQTQRRTSTKVKDSLVLHIRQRDVAIKASGFPSKAKNIHCFFDGIPVSLTPKNSSQNPLGEDFNFKGTLYRTVNSDVAGNLDCTFTIPKGVPCGTKEVKLEFTGDNNYKHSYSGTAQYTANGRKHTTTESIFTKRIVTHAIDPLAQSFMFSEEKYITSVDLYFAVGTDNNSPVMVQIRNMVNGYPGTECYAESVIPSDKILTSNNSSVATNVKFNGAIKCLPNVQYCVVVMSDSSKPALWVAELGETDVLTEKTVMSNPYTAGVLFSSSNALTWTAHQDRDLKLRIKTAKFNPTGNIVFKSVGLSQVNSIVLSVDSVVPAETSLKWEYRQNDMMSWLPLDIFNLVPLEKIGKQIDIRCTYSAKQTRAPMVSTQCMSLSTFTSSLKGAYVTRLIELDEPFNNLKVYLDVLNSSNNGTSVFYSFDDGENWEDLPKAADQSGSAGKSLVSFKKVDAEFGQMFWEVKLKPGELKKLKGRETYGFRILIKLETTEPTILIQQPRCKRLMVIAKTV